MRKGNPLFILFFLIVGLSSFLVASDCYEVINIPVKKVTKVYETYTKTVPYKKWKTVCVPIKDSCNRVIGQKAKKIKVTAYKCVTKKVLKGYNHIGYYNGRKIEYFWPTKLCTIPVQVPVSCCTVPAEVTCNVSCSVN